MTFDEAMEPLYEYVGMLTDVERDSLLAAQDWRPGAYVYQDGARCLVGHVADVRREEIQYWELIENGMKGAVALSGHQGVHQADIYVDGKRITAAFDDACELFGTARVVTALKARAGATVSLPLPESAREASGVAHG